SDISDPKIFYKRAQRKLKLGREKEAIEDCHKAIHLNADYVEAYRLRRMIYLRLGQQVEAAIDMQEIHRLEEAKPFQPKKSEVSQVDSVQSEVKSSKDPDVFYAQAIQNFEQGQYPDAIKNCNRAIRLNPDYLEVYKLRRKICIILGHKDRAAFDTKQINRIESNLAQATNLNQEN
ncbi:MAG: tetratricopeptide repeat protein, partial [Prochlorotrichaceae cyanobacterium]